MIKLNNKEVKIEHFPDGTQRLNDIYIDEENVIEWFYEKEEELSTLIYLTRHLKNLSYVHSIKLQMLYLPNARMDRIADDREVFTLKSFADVINWLNFDVVRILDVHSNVGSALINKAEILSPKDYISMAINDVEEDMIEEDENCIAKTVLYFPDEGAYKRYSKMIPNYEYCYGEKVRDWKTGQILGLDVKTNGIDLTNKTVLMIDDIVAYGGSLFYSAKALKELGVNKIYAYVTHTENSILDKEKGTLIKSLENNTVERLFTTNSLFNGNHEKITVMEV